jgi:hypothetical protein
MKEKIFSALKTACGKTTSISDKTLEKLAEVMAVTVTEESQIEAAIENQKAFLQEFNGNINHVAAEAVKKIQLEKPIDLDEPKKGPGRPKKEVDLDPNEPAWFTAFKKEQSDSVAALKAEIEAQKQEKTLAGLSERVSKHEKLKDIPQSYLKGRNLVPKSEAEIDQLVATIEADYNGFKQEMAEKGVVISVPPTGGGQQGERVTIDAYLDEKFPKEKAKVLTKK